MKRNQDKREGTDTKMSELELTPGKKLQAQGYRPRERRLRVESKKNENKHRKRHREQTQFGQKTIIREVHRRRRPRLLLSLEYMRDRAHLPRRRSRAPKMKMRNRSEDEEKRK